MTSLSYLKNFPDDLPDHEKLMPALFIGHGSPMNAIEDNTFSRDWRKLAEVLPRPKAIICISAHWETQGRWVTAMEKPKTIHDFSGFPGSLYEVVYPAPGSSALAAEIISTCNTAPVKKDVSWGLDHGCWSVLKQMYPDAQIPVVQFSLDIDKDPLTHVQTGGQLATFRKKGILVLGSGNLVHNLAMLNWKMMDGGGYDWALEANDSLKKLIQKNDIQTLSEYKSLGKAVNLSIPTPEHYLPALTILGLRGKNESVTFFNDKAVGGSLTMTSFIIS